MGSAHIDQNFTSVNEQATLDGVVYFFSCKFIKLLTLFKDHLYAQYAIYVLPTSRQYKVVLPSQNRI